jgi:hypothetical protein
MMVLQAVIALVAIPALLGAPLFLIAVLGLSWSRGFTKVAVSAGVGFVLWLALSVELALKPALHCADDCASAAEAFELWAVYALCTGLLALLVGWHYHSRDKACRRLGGALKMKT